MNSHSHAAWLSLALDHGGISTAVCTCDHASREGGDLAFTRGQIITVLCQLREPGTPNCLNGLYLGCIGTEIGYFAGDNVQLTRPLQLPGLVPLDPAAPAGPFAVLSLNIPQRFRLGVFPPLDADTPNVQSTQRFTPIDASPQADAQATPLMPARALGTPLSESVQSPESTDSSPGVSPQVDSTQAESVPQDCPTPVAAEFPDVPLRPASEANTRDPTYSIYEAYYRQSMMIPSDSELPGTDAADTTAPMETSQGDTTYDSFATADSEQIREFVGTARISRDQISAMEPAMSPQQPSEVYGSPPPKSAFASRTSSPSDMSYGSPRRPPLAFESPRWRGTPQSPLRESASPAMLRMPKSQSMSSMDSASSYHTTPTSEASSPVAKRDGATGLTGEPLLFQQWTQLLTSHSSRSTQKARKLIPQGVPRVLRGNIWLLLAQDRMQPKDGIFPELRMRAEGMIASPSAGPYANLIEQDLARHFRSDKPFKGANGTGIKELRIVLYAFAQHCPTIGYTEGMCLIAGLLLMHMSPEDAFWMLDAVINHYGIAAYFSNNTQQVRVHAMVIDELFRLHAPAAHARLHELHIGPLVFMTSWILPLFVRILPWSTLLRVWDSFLCYGSIYLLRTMLAIVRITHPHFPASPDPGETLQFLLQPPSPLLSPSALLPLASDANVRRR